MNYKSPLIIFLFIGFQGISQNIGLRETSYQVADGFTLFTPTKNNNVYLVDNCGQLINEWNFDESPGLTCYLLDNGDLLRAGKSTLEIRDWDDNSIWKYEMDTNNLLQHHDIEPLPNGNILCLIQHVWEPVDIIEQGRDPSLIGNKFRVDAIVEIQPIGTDDALIVWEWDFIDHLIQDYDNSKNNYGVVEDHPELLNINFDNGFLIDFTHCNAIDYNAELDQIALSARHLNEIYFIDHSTTLEEAGTHSGGNSNMGGDLIYRWGNPQVYGQGDVTNQKLHRQHDIKWIPEGYPNEGKLSVFNNDGIDGSAILSSIHLISPAWNGSFYEKSNYTFLPEVFDWTWSGQVLGEDVFDDKMCGVQVQENGNYLITDSGLGQGTEINSNGDVVWVYRNPTGTVIHSQSEGYVVFDNTVFRMEKYPPDFSGFIGKDMTGSNLIEDYNDVSQTCLEELGIEEALNINFQIINPSYNETIQFYNKVIADKISVISLDGLIVQSIIGFNGDRIDNVKKGVYIISIENEGEVITERIIVN